MTDSITNTGKGYFDLEALFKEAAQSEPILVDTNFTKVVINRLPMHQPKEQRHWLPDFLGLAVAFTSIAWFVEPATLAQNLIASVPNSVTISVPSMLIVTLTLVASAVVGWWIVERDG